MKRKYKIKFFSMISIFIISFGFLGVTFVEPLMASEIPKDINESYNKQELTKKIEQHDVTKEKEAENINLINSVPENTIIINDTFNNNDNIKIKEFSELNVSEKELLDNKINEIMKIVEENTTLNEKNQLIFNNNGLSYYETKDFTIKQLKNDIVVSFPTFSTYINDNETIEFIEQVPNARGSWKYQTSTRSNNSGYSKLIAIASTGASFAATFIVPGLGKAVFVTTTILSVGSYYHKTVYYKNTIYYNSSCYSYKKIKSYGYQWGNYTGYLGYYWHYTGSSYLCGG